MSVKGMPPSAKAPAPAGMATSIEPIILMHNCLEMLLVVPIAAISHDHVAASAITISPCNFKEVVGQGSVSFQGVKAA